MLKNTDKMKVWVAMDSAGQLHVCVTNERAIPDVGMIFNEVGLSLDRQINWVHEAATSAEVLAGDFK